MSVDAVPGAPAALAELTPQQREIVVLAGSGLTNREIADRLFLSPRTVASHLYRSYPKLGISGRHQLRDLIARAAVYGRCSQVADTLPPASGGRVELYGLPVTGPPPRQPW